jgi:DNA-binding GntR family transcriptional regulator
VNRFVDTDTLAVADESPVDSSLTDKAYLRLEEMIVTLQLKPGEVLSETALTGKLNIGRTPVREALHRLAREGLVMILPRRGILVAEFNIKSQLKMLEVRREIERLMARSAAERASAAEREQFRELAHALRASAERGDDIGFMRLDRTFNRLIEQTARNEFASKTIALMSGLSRRFWFMHHQHVSDMPVAAERHAAVADAIAAADAPAAAVASDELLQYIEGIPRAAVDW